eukprot:303980-Chlamydomonas_euryale.AAC.18
MTLRAQWSASGVCKGAENRSIYAQTKIATHREYLPTHRRSRPRVQPDAAAVPCPGHGAAVVHYADTNATEHEAESAKEAAVAATALAADADDAAVAAAAAAAAAVAAVVVQTATQPALPQDPSLLPSRQSRAGKPAACSLCWTAEGRGEPLLRVARAVAGALALAASLFCCATHAAGQGGEVGAIKRDRAARARSHRARTNKIVA